MLGLTYWGSENSRLECSTGFEQATNNTLGDKATPSIPRSGLNFDKSALLRFELAPQTRNVNSQVASKIFGGMQSDHDSAHNLRSGDGLRCPTSFQLDCPKLRKSRNDFEFQHQTPENHSLDLTTEREHPLGQGLATSSWKNPEGLQIPDSSIWGDGGNLFQQSAWTNSNSDRGSSILQNSGKRLDLQPYLGHVQHTL